MIQTALFWGAVGGVMLALIAFLLSKLGKDLAARTLLATVIFAAAGAYIGFAFRLPPTLWLLLELLQCIAIGALGLYGWRGQAKWLALAWALHPVWDFPLHYLGPGRNYTPAAYPLACLSLDWIVAAYIFFYYRRQM